MRIRTEEIKDDEAVHHLNVAAFGNREDEAQLVERIRSSEGFIPKLSIVAEIDHKLVGHILLSKAKVVDAAKEHEVIVLAPIAVNPDYQKQGVGSQLILEGIRRTKDIGYGAVFLIGHPTYYPKFGFKPARSYGYELKQFQVPDEVFMVCEVVKGQLQNMKGELQYPDSFFS
ncbi:GNAT family N-acetyltransferase [Paenibacillus aceris]|uniref:N-acetyltransferase YhbS n=1 Tax=Paenibacillus aceris TaxID=869555 RepID=A0ABS4HQU4_9BACL|nr:N-acetyltransferase [Paenibacillus aceris]MBP1960985.1 putative N-acetyltransferase YhbS [Paenibacillus aceris]NHW35350.1 N-acetyltransferase [Paenibacillus aceris]